MFDLNKIVRTNILALEPYSSARYEYSKKDGVFLDANENPYGTLNRYPDPYQTVLKKKLSKIKNIDINNIFIGNGSDEIIDLTYRIFCNPNIDKALVFTPTYGMYDVSANINNIEVIKVPLISNFQIDLNSIVNYLKDDTLKLIFICSPNNPTGNLIKPKDIVSILEIFKGIVFIDEAYIDFSNSDSWIKMIEKYSNLIVSQTFSKARGLAAARVGVAYGNNKIISLLNKVKPPYNVSELNQQAAYEALKNDAIFKQNLSFIKTEKSILIKKLSQLKSVIKVFPSDANFLLLEVSNADKIYNGLILKKIIIRNRNNIIKNCIRITIGNSNENQLLIDELKNLE